MFDFQVETRAHFDAEQSTPQQGRYRFAYTITITNRGEVAAQLIARHWLITDALDMQQEVHGLGVVGRQPLLQPGESFSYTSSCELRTPSGHMQGSYLCVTEHGESFDAAIGRFDLDAATTLHADHAIPTPSSRTLH